MFILSPDKVSIRLRLTTRQPAQNGTSAGSNPAGRTSFTPRLPMVRPADSKPAIGCSNHPRGAKRRNSKWRAAGLQPRRTRHNFLPRTTDLRLCALQSAAALQVFS